MAYFHHFNRNGENVQGEKDKRCAYNNIVNLLYVIFVT